MYATDDVKNVCNSKNFIVFAAGTNVKNGNTGVLNRIYNDEYEADEH